MYIYIYYITVYLKKTVNYHETTFFQAIARCPLPEPGTLHLRKSSVACRSISCSRARSTEMPPRIDGEAPGVEWPLENHRKTIGKWGF